MNRKYLLTLLLAAVACSDDSPVSYTRGPSVEVDESGFETVSGIVVTEYELRSDDGRTVPLLGPQTTMLTNLIGAEVRILGSADEFGATALWIVEFRVLRVDGLPALDGTLWELPDGFAITTTEGDMQYVHSIPEDLAIHAGKRVWLTTRDGDCIRYGVLEMEM
jgi:hypothetical protein